MDTFAQIIDSFDGPGAFAKAIGIPGSHARAMKTRNSIPDVYWMRTVEAAKARDIEGVTLECLAKIAESRLESASEAAQ